MREREPILVGGLVALLFVLWLGFPFHSSPRFAGSFWGGVLAVTGASLMLVPIGYSIIKRKKRCKKFVKRFISMRTVLALHVYAGVFGPLLVMIHTGHKFQSTLGIALTTMTLTVVLSGFIGRFLMSRISRKIKAKKATLSNLGRAYEATEGELRIHPEEARRVSPFTWSVARISMRLLLKPEPDDKDISPTIIQSVNLAESIADLEYSIHTHEMFRRVFRIWLRAHIVISVVLYVLLALHIWAAIHFGLRWFE